MTLIDIRKHMPDYKKAIVKNTNIEDLISDRYGLRYIEQGDELRCSCPLPYGNHKNGDRNPSFSVNKENGLWNCYVCGAGNILQFVMVMEDATYDQAIDILRGYQNIITDDAFEGIVASYGAEIQAIHTIEQYYDLEVKKWAQNSTEYWKSRGFMPYIEKIWKLGYDPVDNRAVIPHYFGGKCVGYQKRSLDGNGPKWKNSPDFPRSNTLFNYDSCKSSYKSVIIVEAAASVIWLSQCGIDNVLASFGSKVTKEQAKLLRCFDRVTIWFDPDIAGQNGKQALANYLDKHLECYIINASGDPNELTSQQCRDAIDNAIPY